MSTSRGLGLGDEVGPEGSLVAGKKGGGSMAAGAGDLEGTAGSGRADKLSSADEVSIVIFFVDTGAFLMV